MEENNDALKNQAINFAKNLFSFAGKNFSYIIYGDSVYFRGKDVAEYLGYKDTKKALVDNVDENHKKTLGEIMEMIEEQKKRNLQNEKNKFSKGGQKSPLEKSKDFRGNDSLPLNKNSDFKGNYSLLLKKNEDFRGGYQSPLNFQEETKSDFEILSETDEEKTCEKTEEVKTIDVILLKKGKQKFKKLTWNEKNTIYITEPGLYMLVTSSKKQEAKSFRDYIYTEIIPTIRKTGKFSLFEENSKVDTKLIIDTSYAKSFYDTNTVAKFYGKSTVYLGAVGIYDGKYLLKFGESNDIFRRDFYEHRNTFGPQFKIIYIGESDNSRIIEMLFEREIKIRNLNIDLHFNGKMQKELFVTSNTFTIENAIELIDKLILENPSFSTSTNSLKIMELATKKLELELETKKLELEIMKETNKTNIKKILDKPNIKTITVEVPEVKNGIDIKKINDEDLEEIPDEDKPYFNTFDCDEFDKRRIYYLAKNAKNNDTDDGAIIGCTTMTLNRIYKFTKENMDNYNDLYHEFMEERNKNKK